MLVEVLLLKWRFNKKQVAWGHDLPSAERIGIWFYRNNFSKEYYILEDGDILFAKEYI